MAHTTSSGSDCKSSENAAEFESLLVRLSTSFAGARWHEVGGEVNRSLQALLGFCCVDQACIFEVLPGKREAFLRYIADRVDEPRLPERFSYGKWFPWAFQKTVCAAEALAVPEPEKLPPDAAVDQASMRSLGLQSMLHIPLQVEGEVSFVLTVACNCGSSKWNERSLTRLKALGEICAHAIARAEAAGALLANQHDLTDALNIAHLGHWQWDAGADRLLLSDEAKHIIGADVPSLAHFLELVEPADRREVEESIRDVLAANPGTRLKTRYAVRTPAGERRTIQQWHEVVFPGERTARIAATVQDVTAMINAEQEMAELRAHHWHSARVAQTSLLVASLAHELCQPLSAILNNAQAGLRFLKSGNLSDQDMEAILTDIVASNKRAGEVLSALRAMLRRRNTTRITFEASDAVQDILSLVRNELMTEQIDVETALAPGCYLNADKTQIGQVLLNLVLNSIDAMRGKQEAEKRLGLTLCLGDLGEVRFVVKDTGRGIPHGKLPKVFEAFWTTKDKGLGMGLAVSRAIVESYGGHIWCENNEAGGTTFHVKMPAAYQPEHAGRLGT